MKSESRPTQTLIDKIQFPADVRVVCLADHSSVRACRGMDGDDYRQAIPINQIEWHTAMAPARSRLTPRVGHCSDVSIKKSFH